MAISIKSFGEKVGVHCQQLKTSLSFGKNGLLSVFQQDAYGIKKFTFFSFLLLTSCYEIGDDVAPVQGPNTVAGMVDVSCNSQDKSISGYLQLADQTNPSLSGIRIFVLDDTETLQQGTIKLEGGSETSFGSGVPTPTTALDVDGDGEVSLVLSIASDPSGPVSLKIKDAAGDSNEYATGCNFSPVDIDTTDVPETLPDRNQNIQGSIDCSDLSCVVARYTIEDNYYGHYDLAIELLNNAFLGDLVFIAVYEDGQRSEFFRENYSSGNGGPNVISTIGLPNIGDLQSIEVQFAPGNQSGPVNPVFSIRPEGSSGVDPDSVGEYKSVNVGC